MQAEAGSEMQEVGGVHTTILDQTGLGLDTDHVMSEFMAQAPPEVAALVRWQQGVRGRRGGIFDRDQYVTPEFPWQQFRTAQRAVENDDIVSGVLETTEALAFGRMSIATDDDDEADIWEQIAQDIDLDARMREMWREEFTCSQMYIAVYDGIRDYKVSGKGPGGRSKRKSFNGLRVPIGITMLDPCKIVPVGNTLFNQDQLAYAADVPELDVINAVINGQRDLDPVIGQLLVRPYQPDLVERTQLSELGLPTGHLYLMDSNRVFRHTATRPQYKRFADVRLKTVFELLDMKTQLREMDRAMLLGGTNYLVLVKRGSDKIPATNPEVRDTESRFRSMARVPVIVGDHRLSVEIITPHSDYTLDADRYDTIDSRITIRLFSMFISNKQQSAARTDDSIKLARVIGRSLESRRFMLKKTIERRIIKPTFEKNDQFSQMPELRFHPKRVALDLDPALLNYILDIYDRGDISRETLLEQIDISQETEAHRRADEKVRYDKIFETQIPGMPVPTDDTGTPVPQSRSTGNPPPASRTKTNAGKTPANQTVSADPKTAGRRGGGNRGGGGAGRTGDAARNAGKPQKDDPEAE